MRLRTLSLAALLILLPTAPAADPAERGRRVLSLDGAWQIADARGDAVPARFDHTVPVPGLVSQAEPPFADPPGPKVADRRAGPQKDPHRDYFWYRRTFRLDGPVPAVARLKVHKAMFGTKVVLNGQSLGEHQACFTPGWFDARAALKTGDNEMLIRVGADRDTVGPAIPSGFDYEKDRYIPGIFDSVELILSGTPHVVRVQAVPDLAGRSVRVLALIRNDGPETKPAVAFSVREPRPGNREAEVGTVAAPAAPLAPGAETTLDVRIPLPGCRAWSPEDPFLYTLTVDTGADRLRTRFGMREFHFDPKSGRAILNGQPYPMRGSNITLYRFFEDAECRGRPWDRAWVRTMHQRVKDMHWNCLRYCIGFPPEAWYDIADELGLLIQDEFPIWFGGPGWSKWPPELKRDQLAREYTEWMQERWNHPCVVIWDATNETSSPETAAAVRLVRGLDLSNRPWDNSYMPPEQPGDVLESHPYHFQNANFKLRDLAHADPVPQGNPVKNDGQHAVVINEYGWLWLNRDGSPTTLTRDLYRNLLGPDSTPEQRRRLYARYTAAETEFWRSHRKAAAVMHFTTLGYSRHDGQTSDHWLDVGQLTWEPEFLRFVKDAFAPVGLMIDAWADEYPPGQEHVFPVAIVNDLPTPWKGEVRIRLVREGRSRWVRTQPAEVPPLGHAVVSFAVPIPTREGAYEVEAALLEPGKEPVRSVRDFEVLSEAQRRARRGLAVGRPVKASSSIARDGATSAEAAVDGRLDTRWSSEFSDPQWLAVDLGEVTKVSRVELLWEAAYARAYAIEVSSDGQTWKAVARTDAGQGGTEVVRFAPTDARWVRFFGTRRATPHGYSLWEFRVFP